MVDDIDTKKIRLDQWLWAARLYKTRRIAKEFIEGGKVHINNNRCKASKKPEVGDVVQVKMGFDQRVFIIKALIDQRKSYEFAQQLYEETEQSIKDHQTNLKNRQLMRHTNPKPVKRPNKKQRRDIVQYKTTLYSDHSEEEL